MILTEAKLCDTKERIIFNPKHVSHVQYRTQNTTLVTMTNGKWFVIDCTLDELLKKLEEI